MKDREEEDDASYIRIPTAIAYALVGALGIGGTGVVGYVRQTPDQNELAQLEKDVRGLREKYETIMVEHRGFFREHAKFEESVRAWMEVANANSGRITANRELIYEKTANRFSSADHEKYRGEQESRDQDQNRRISTLERQIDQHEKSNAGKAPILFSMDEAPKIGCGDGPPKGDTTLEELTAWEKRCRGSLTFP